MAEKDALFVDGGEVARASPQLEFALSQPRQAHLHVKLAALLD
jgi:hypothetical protein